MSVEVHAVDDTLEHTTVDLTYVAMPYVDPGRLAAAAAALAPRVPVSSLPAGVTGPVLQALQVDQQSVTYSLSVPGGTPGFEVRNNAVVDLRAGIGDTLTASLTDFQAIYGALFENAELFHGIVEVRLGAGAIHTEHIELVGDLSDMAGAAPVAAVQGPGPPPGSVSVTLSNSIESPVEIDGLTASLRSNGSSLPAAIQGVDATRPVRLAPGAATTFTVVYTDASASGSPAAPGTSVPAGGPGTSAPSDPSAPAAPPGSVGSPGAAAPTTLIAVLDLSGLKVLPDAQAIWDSILDAHAANAYAHTIKLEVYQSAFNPAADNPQDRVEAVQVAFVQNGTVEVTPDQLPAPATGPNPPEPRVTMTVTLHMPIRDFVLNTPQLGQFQYRVIRVRTSGPVVGDLITVTIGDTALVQ
jgi:hypothetical protein